MLMPSASEAIFPRFPGDTPRVVFFAERLSLWRKAGIVMRANLHHRAPNTYYGQWLLRFPKERGLEEAVQCP